MKHITRTVIASVAGLLLATLGFGGATASATSKTECGSTNGYLVTVEGSAESCPFASEVADVFPADFKGDTATISVLDLEGGQHQITCARKYQLVIECRDALTEALVYLNPPHPGGEAG